MWSVSAFAQKTQPKTINIDEVDDIEGLILKPLGENEGITLHKKTKSLLKLRSSFVPEIIATANDI